MYGMYDRLNTYGYTFWNLEAASLNPSLQNLQLSQNNIYQTAINRSYDANLNTHQLNRNSMVNQSNNSTINFVKNQTNRNFGVPTYLANSNSKRYSNNYEYQLNDYIYTSNLNRVSFGERPLTWVVSNSGGGSAQKRLNRNYKVYMFEANEDGESVETDEDVSITEFQPDYDTFDHYDNLISKQLSKEMVELLRRNQECLSVLIEGDILEYVVDERDFEDSDNKHKWAIYMGNSMIMRRDNTKKQIVYESYWKVANENYIYINKDLDKKLKTLPIYETLYRARRAHKKKQMTKQFSSDKNFAMWCRFDVNKSDIEMATEYENYSVKGAKIFVISKFLERLNEAKELNKSRKKKVDK